MIDTESDADSVVNVGAKLIFSPLMGASHDVRERLMGRGEILPLR